MIDCLKPYPEYKDSGVPWLGMVPAGACANGARLAESGTAQPHRLVG